MQWDSAAYLQFESERTQPSVDLVKRIELERPRKLLDVGCGPGNSTQVLADAFPNALRIIGIDSSPEMIETAKDDHPDMEFRILDASALPSPTPAFSGFRTTRACSGTCWPCSVPAACSPSSFP